MNVFFSKYFKNQLKKLKKKFPKIKDDLLNKINNLNLKFKNALSIKEKQKCYEKKREQYKLNP